MNIQVISLISYGVLIVISGAAEYFHMVPSGTLAVVLGGVLGHNISIATSDNTIKKVAEVMAPKNE